MAIVKSKPTSPGRRGLISVKSDLYKGKPHKSLIEPNLKMVEEIIMEELQCGVKAEATSNTIEL